VIAHGVPDWLILEPEPAPSPRGTLADFDSALKAVYTEESITTQLYESSPFLDLLNGSDVLDMRLEPPTLERIWQCVRNFQMRTGRRPTAIRLDSGQHHVIRRRLKSNTSFGAAEPAIHGDLFLYGVRVVVA
jgi:hypothetical protein